MRSAGGSRVHLSVHKIFRHVPKRNGIFIKYNELRIRESSVLSKPTVIATRTAWSIYLYKVSFVVVIFNPPSAISNIVKTHPVWNCCLQLLSGGGDAVRFYFQFFFLFFWFSFWLTNDAAFYRECQRRMALSRELYSCRQCESVVCARQPTRWCRQEPWRLVKGGKRKY